MVMLLAEEDSQSFFVGSESALFVHREKGKLALSEQGWLLAQSSC